MPSRQMGMSIGSRHAREQCVHQGCVEQPYFSLEILKGQFCADYWHVSEVGV